MPQSLNNYFVGKKVRDITQRPGISNMQLLDHCSPVAVINPSNSGVEVQPSLPKANANQIAHYTVIRISTANTWQVATASSNKAIYLTGIAILNQAAVASGAIIYDATSGSAPTVAAGSAGQDTAGFLQVGCPATDGVNMNIPIPLPIKMTAGIRVDGGGASVGCLVFIQWIEETVTPTI